MISGINIPNTSVYSLMIFDAFLPVMSFLNSSAILSSEISLKRSFVLKIASEVFSSILNPRTAENLSALNILKASSVNLSSGSPTALMILSFISFTPPNRSTGSPSESM